MNRINNLAYKPITLSKKRLARTAHLRNVVKRKPKCVQKQSATEKKLDSFKNSINQDINNNVDSEFILVHKSVLQNLVSSQSCKICNNDSLEITTAENKGFAVKLVIKCKHCPDAVQEFYTSPKSGDLSRSPFLVNKNIVESIVMMGLGYAGMQRFCMGMNMNIMNKNTFNNILQDMTGDFVKLRQEVLRMAREKVRQSYLKLDESLDSDSLVDICLSYDGTYQKRGFTSLYGIGIVIDILTGLVVDYVILSKYCRECEVKKKSLGEDSEEFKNWLIEHKASGKCEQNFDGSSASMEAYAAELMWKRSENSKLRYTHVLSDGDAKSFNHVDSLNVYGPYVQLVREQCVNHVSKCLVRALKNVVKECAIKGVTLGGRKPGALTAKVIGDLAGYYRNSIVEYSPDADAMKRAILAPLEHYSSTDDEPKHNLCPEGVESWCWYNRSIASNQVPPSHNLKKPKINATVIKYIRPIYERLSDVELLKRCIRGGTQNANESLHNMIWARCSKEKFQSLKKLDMCVVSAISEFNLGCENANRLKSSVLGVQESDVSRRISSLRDRTRLRKSKNLEDSNIKKVEKRRKQQLKSVESKKRKTEGLNYEAGAFDK